jgi:DNA-binding MarR family transcriptional regulator
MIKNDKISIDTVIENLMSIMPLLSKSFKKAIRRKTNHTPGSLFLLGALSNHGVLSMTEIGCHLAVPKPHVTNMIDKLIADNLVERLDDPTDRRIVKIRITDKGIEDFNAIKMEISQGFRLKLEQLDNDKLQDLSEASSLVKDVLRWIVLEQPSSGVGSCKE